MTGPDPELLRAEFLGITVRHEAADTSRADLAALFADMSTRYELNRMEFVDGGATLAGASGSEVVLRPDQTASAGVTGLGFREGLDRVSGMLRDALARVETRDRLWIDDVTLVAVWDCETEDGARRYLSDDVLGLGDESQELLAGDDDEASHGLRVWRRLGNGTLDVAVEPMHTDTSKIYVRLVYSDDDVADGADAVIESAEAVNEYLHGPLVAFVRARARR